MAMATAQKRIVSELENLWQEINRAEVKRNYVRAVALARQLELDEQRLRPLQYKAIQQFLVEYQNFDGAARLCAEYSITADELAALTEDALKQAGLETKTNYSLLTGQPSYLSVAAQIRLFAQRQLSLLRKGELYQKGKNWWQRFTTAIRSWVDRLFTPWHGGQFPHGGVA